MILSTLLIRMKRFDIRKSVFIEVDGSTFPLGSSPQTIYETLQKIVIKIPIIECSKCGQKDASYFSCWDDGEEFPLCKNCMDKIKKS